MININEVLSFLQVVQCGSFQAAARQFGTPKSTLSRQVAQLEMRLGVSLLHRTTRKVSLTPAGENLFSRTSNILDQITEAESALKSEQFGLSGRIRLTAPVDMGPALLAKTIVDFKEQFPLVALELMLTDRVVDLIGERFDLALRVGELPDSNFKFKKVTSHQMVLTATPSYLNQHGRPEHSRDLLKHTLISFSPGLRSVHWDLTSGKTKVRLPIPKQYCMSSFAMCLELVKESMGISLMPQFMLKNSLLTGELEHLLPDWHTPTHPISLVWPHQEHPPARIKALIDHLARALNP
jgi:DNA-binding transcriptional LysR family regulator